jgi:hypothetical protein
MISVPADGEANLRAGRPTVKKNRSVSQATAVLRMPIRHSGPVFYELPVLDAPDVDASHLNRSTFGPVAHEWIASRIPAVRKLVVEVADNGLPARTERCWGLDRWDPSVTDPLATLEELNHSSPLPAGVNGAMPLPPRRATDAPHLRNTASPKF